MPEELDELERRITQLEIERQALNKEKDSSKERHGQLKTSWPISTAEDPARRDQGAVAEAKRS